MEQLNPDELRRERIRCATLSTLALPKIAKGLKKRLLKIEERMQNLGRSG